ncbi:VWA domain-containing protein [Sulfurimonas sp.]|uniref:VWA domain-containing protein n=1 Tax=Sulfurimonas sp. TaxID=2022749 RepID=UPI0035619DF2
MSFLHPEFLYYMLPPLIILFGLLLTQKETQAHFFSKEVMDKLRVGANTLTLRARNALFFMIGLFIIIALAQPIIDDGVVTVKAKSADIMIALDISDSMLAEDVYPNRLELAKQKALTLLSEAPDERIGIMAFAKNSYLVSPLSFDTSAVSFLLTQLDTTSITQKGTDFLSILDVFSKSQNSEGEKYLLILSDGGDSKDFSAEIELAKKSNIVVFILGIGTTKGAPIKLKNGSFIKQHGEILVSKLNENISELATSSGGVYIQNTTSTSDIEAMLGEIKNISKEKDLKSEEIHKYIPLFYYPVAMSLFLLLIATSSMSKRVRVELPSLLLLSLFMSASMDLRGGILDFMDLNEAKEAYKSEDYEKSGKLYEKYAEESKKGESYFNAGNSLYKQKKYEEAVNLYERATFNDNSLRAKNFSNMGNAHAKGQNLQRAVESYEKSLEIEEDKNTRENLEEVKKLLKKQKQKQDSKKSDKQNDKKDKKKDDKSESQDSKDGEKDSDKKDKSKEDEDSSKSKKSKDKEQKSDDMKSKEEKDSDTEDKKNEKNEKEQLEKLDKDDEKKSSDSKSKAQNLSKEKMSDAEEAKWLDQLNLQKNSYLYKLGEQKPMKETSDEKPW